MSDLVQIARIHESQLEEVSLDTTILHFNVSLKMCIRFRIVRAYPVLLFKN